MPNETIAFPGTVLMPGLIRPTLTDTSGAPTIDNSEILKIANDVLAAAKYSIAAVAAQENLEEVEFRSDTMEAAFKETFMSLKPERQQKLRAKATDLVKDKASREVAFGRYGQLDVKSFLGAGGFDRVRESLPELEIDKTLLGVEIPTVSVSPEILRHTSEGLLIPADRLPPDFEESDFEDAKSSLEEAIRAAEETDVYDLERLEEIWGPAYATDPFGTTDFEEFEEQAITDKLGFYITRVKCVDETNPERIWAFGWHNWVHDDIDIGGVTVDETGDTKKIAQTRVGRGWDDGAQRRYSPHWQFTWFNMREEHGLPGAKWPKRYTVSLFLAELDHGGFESFLSTAWKYFKDQVKAAIEEAVTGALSGWLGTAIANAIGKAVAWVVDKLIGWIISLFKDDVFPAYIARCTVPSYYARWYYPSGKWGSTTSGIHRAHFYGYGGHYFVEYYWRLFA